VFLGVQCTPPLLLAPTGPLINQIYSQASADAKCACLIENLTPHSQQHVGRAQNAANMLPVCAQQPEGSRSALSGKVAAKVETCRVLEKC
jgi:prephenate dehydratase